ncbi:MAG: bacteriohopanetetrol glucosamine biosynthesis glycosyltransferase HpnI [Gammaproteobacteria bacterium]
MQTTLYDVILFVTVVISFSTLSYMLFAAICMERFHRGKKANSSSSATQRPVTILKPVCGLDHEMAINLRSFCEQDYAEYQVIFGVHDKNDPAVPIIRELIKDYPTLDIDLVIDQRIHGTNHKVSNLINMFPRAKHEILFIADSDMRVPEDYLNAVVNHFSDEEIGAVTCLYSGSSRGGIASSLNAMFINEWFFPSVLISRLLQETRYCLGATMVVRREILEEIGGFEALSDHLADDYMLGKLITDKGYKIHLSHFVVENIVHEPSIKSLLLHELRWARTLRAVEPINYVFTFLTDTFVISCMAGIIAFLYTGQLAWPVSIIGFVLLARILLHLRINYILNTNESGSFWLVPVRDIISFFIRFASFTGNTVEWRTNTFSVDTDGLIYNGESYQYQLDENKEIPDLVTNEDY